MPAILPILLIAVAVATGASAASPSHPATAQDCPLCGKWRSNAARTLADIESHAPSYPAGLRKMFGTLVIEYTATSIRAYSHDDPKADSVPWSAYKLDKRPSGQASLLRTENPDGSWRESTLEIDKNCYRVPVSTRQGPGFHEFFCRDTK